MLETEFEGNLYKTVYISPSGIGWSLTGISERLAFFFVAFWIVTIVGLSFHANGWTLFHFGRKGPLSETEIETFCSWLFAMAGSYSLWRSSSGIKGELTPYPDDFNPGATTRFRPTIFRNKAGKQFLVTREPGIF